MSWKHPRFCRCHIYKNFFLFHGSIAEINGCFGWQNIAYQITLNCLFKKKKKREKKNCFVFLHCKTDSNGAKSDITFCLLNPSTNSLSVSAAQHKTFPVDISEPFYTHTASFVLSFPQTSALWFWEKIYIFWKFYASFVLITGVQLTCKGDDT